MQQVLWLPGDGVGPEVSAQARRVLSEIAAKSGREIRFHEGLIGGCAIEAQGDPLPQVTLDLARQSDAVFLGAVGGPAWDHLAGAKRPEAGLLGLRKGLGLYANLRPIAPHPSLAGFSPLKAERLDGVDFMVVRELTGGIYFGEHREGDQEAVDVCTYSRSEIERVVALAADLARTRRGKLTLVDKANVLATSRLWRKVTQELIEHRYPDLELEILLVDAAAMHLLTRAADFDVLVTENLFGDILTDEASVICGSLGMLGSASIGAGGPGLYEPIHGSAPDIAGRGIANPLGALSSLAMMLEHSLGWTDAARALEAAIAYAIAEGAVTADLGGSLSTEEAGSAVLAAYQRQSKAA